MVSFQTRMTRFHLLKKASFCKALCLANLRLLQLRHTLLRMEKNHKLKLHNTRKSIYPSIAISFHLISDIEPLPSPPNLTTIYPNRMPPPFSISHFPKYPPFARICTPYLPPKTLLPQTPIQDHVPAIHSNLQISHIIPPLLALSCTTNIAWQSSIRRFSRLEGYSSERERGKGRASKRNANATPQATAPCVYAGFRVPGRGRGEIVNAGFCVGNSVWVW